MFPRGSSSTAPRSSSCLALRMVLVSGAREEGAITFNIQRKLTHIGGDVGRQVAIALRAEKPQCIVLHHILPIPHEQVTLYPTLQQFDSNGLFGRGHFNLQGLQSCSTGFLLKAEVAGYSEDVERFSRKEIGFAEGFTTEFHHITHDVLPRSLQDV
ncbi:hypothetical protein OBBRIDRAFT_521725 [Obba rivulosa]|uniref:Uncharacterized protein n=1 Tax=Obba rivulosa TaxID=1052685 RepID=A0A8E2B0A6_9APHY|nr:hypothetical protein OBBRIDRAFT_521725 [Obba rivulosa]